VWPLGSLVAQTPPFASINNNLNVVFLRYFPSQRLGVSQFAKHNYSKQLRDAATGHRGPFPGLTRALCVAHGDRSHASAENICHVLRVFVQLAMDVTEAVLIYIDAWTSATDVNSQLSDITLPRILEDGLF
jgi:hypothetical protein